jgi:sterol desaturase/sphingolipid hydroxylase (fatty acid hydroxylase superfamily)
MNSYIAIPIVFLVIVYWLEIRFPHIPGRGKRSGHTATNLTVALLGGLLNVVFLLTVLDFITQWTAQNGFGLLYQINASGNSRLFLALFLFDLWMYGWHVMNHRVPLLWKLHRAHHNDISMDSTTALRFHPLEILLSQVFNIGIIITLGMSVRELLVYNLILQMVIFFHHSNVGLPERWDRLLRSLFVMPNMHRVHHSIESFETNSNYSSIFSFWDRVFRTFRKRGDTRSINFGLPYFRESAWQSLLGFIKIPFVR